MLKTKLGRAFMAITTVVLAAFATAVSANCTSMAQPLPSTYQTAAPAAGCGATMSMDCMLQMHGFDTYISSISSPSTLRINPLAHFAAPVPTAPIMRQPEPVWLRRVNLHPPPADPVPLAIRYSVFLK